MFQSLESAKLFDGKMHEIKRDKGVDEEYVVGHLQLA